MKTNNLFGKSLSFMMLAALVASAPLFTSCDKDEDTDDKTTVVAGDKTELLALIAECEELVSGASEDDYPADAISTLSTTLTAVTEAAEGDLTQTVIDNLYTQLENAMTIFLATAYANISSENLVLEWTFDEGSGSSLTSTGTQAWVATLNEGPSEVFATDTQKPQFVDGVSGSCLNFTNGGHLSVDTYTSSTLLSDEITISVWVNPTTTRDNNYIISFNYWKNWKFNLQGQNKPFMTFATDLGITDADNEMDYSAQNGSWTHLVVSVSLTSDTMTFYVNGELTKTWTSSDKPYLAGSAAAEYESAVGKLPLLIGACTTYDEVCSWSWTSLPIAPESWNYFDGMIDELKVYNVALTSGQVLKLYSDEKM